MRSIVFELTEFASRKTALIKSCLGWLFHNGVNVQTAAAARKPTVSRARQPQARLAPSSRSSHKPQSAKSGRRPTQRVRGRSSQGNASSWLLKVCRHFRVDRSRSIAAITGRPGSRRLPADCAARNGRNRHAGNRRSANRQLPQQRSGTSTLQGQRSPFPPVNLRCSSAGSLAHRRSPDSGRIMAAAAGTDSPTIAKFVRLCHRWPARALSRKFQSAIFQRKAKASSTSSAWAGERRIV